MHNSQSPTKTEKVVMLSPERANQEDKDKTSQDKQDSIKRLRETCGDDEIPKEIRAELQTLKASVRKLNQKFQAIEKSQQFISKKYDTFLKEIQEVKDENQKVESHTQNNDKDNNVQIN